MMEEERMNDAHTKIIDLPTLRHISEQAKSEKKKVVWTNGCYDILHAGHVRYLQSAKSCGDILVVGVNSDRSIRAVKGEQRPIVNEKQRAIVLAALTCVDYIIIFDADSPVGIIQEIQPDVYAKGGDYTIETINQQERRLVESYGGDIALIPGVEGLSTTEIIGRIVKSYSNEE